MRATHRSGVQAALEARWLVVIEWALIFGALVLWASAPVFRPPSTFGAVLLAGSALARWLRLGRPSHPTPLDLPLLVFTVSALVSFWAAPNSTAALGRLWLLLGALGVYYALANSQGLALRLATLGLVLLAASAAVVWALGFGRSRLFPNDLAAVQAVLAPVALALCVSSARAWQTRRALTTGLVAALAALALLVIVPTPFLTQSRTVWLAWAGALTLAGWWWLAGRLIFPSARASQQPVVFWSGVGLAAAVGVGLLAWRLPWVVQGLQLLPGEELTTGLGRFVLFGQAWQLAQATPFTGGGLGSFPALYSTYIHDIPHFLFFHAHNSYLNLLVEQGWPGLAAFAVVLAAAGWATTRALARPAGPGRNRLVAGSAGLVIVSLHGLGDASLTATWAAPLLLVPAGLVVSTLPTADTRRRLDRRVRSAGAALVLVTVVALLWGYRSLAAAWRVNLGTVTAARAQLATWPTGTWDEGTPNPALLAAGQHFEAALAWQPENFSAHYHLGLLARRQQDFEAAAAHLAHALAADPQHRGVIKTLGYTYAWLGRFEAAQPLLAQIPEARRELEAYHQWWSQQQRNDLAENARQMRRLLGP